MESETAGAVIFLAVAATITAALVVPVIWALVDASRAPPEAWAATNRKRSRWILVLVLGLWAWVVGLPAWIVYLRRVRPQLRRAMAQLGIEQPSPARGSRIAVIVGIGAVAALWTFGFWTYLTHEHAFFDARVVREVSAICKDARAELQRAPRLPPSPASDDRADLVEAWIPIYERMVERLRQLVPPGKDPGYDEWVRDWREFMDVGPRYADALRTGDPAVYEPIGNEGDRPVSEANAVARDNGMEACVF